MKPTTALLFVLALIQTSAPAAAQWNRVSRALAGSSQAENPEPQLLFRELDGDPRVLTAEADGSCPVNALVGRAVRGLASRLGARVSLLGAVVSQEGDDARATFDVATPEALRGILLCRTDGGLCHVAVVMDQRARARTTLPELLARLSHMGKKTHQLVQIQLPDGSGSLRIPTDWSLVYGREGMVEVAGPENQNLAFGIHFTISTPEATARFRHMMLEMGMPPEQLERGLPITAALSTPERAFEDVIPQVIRRSGASVERLQIVETKEVTTPSGRAVYLLADGVTVRDGVRSTTRGLYFIYTASITQDQWMLYYSGISAPKGHFDRDFPAMLEAWNSFQVSGKEFERRSQKALGTMREISSIQSATRKIWSDSAGRMHQAWTHTLRNTWAVDDQANGTRHSVDDRHMNSLVEELNRSVGYERFRVVPISEL